MADGKFPLSIGLSGLVAYSAVMILLSLSFVWSSYFRKSSTKLGTLAANVRFVFRLYVYMFLIGRISWFVLHTWVGNNDLTFTLNRLSIVTFLTAFTLILFYWAERFHKNYFDTRGFLPKLGWLFIVFNVLLYIFQMTAVILYITSDHDHMREGNPIYEVTILVDVFLSIAISVGFFIYGWLLFWLTKNSLDEAVESREKELLKILIITIFFTVCFLGRGFMFMYRPLTDQKLPDGLFYTVAYFIPELLPTLVQVYVSETSRGKEETDAKYIDQLYRQSQASIEEYLEQRPSERAHLLTNERKRETFL